MDGFLLMDKPGGWTSHDVVAKVRNLIGIRKIGHAGTLDPMATGLLVLGVGRATRLLRFVQDAPKVYEGCACLGVATDTLDADGAVLTREPMPVDVDHVRCVMERFVGPGMQVPPMVSARKVAGRRLYELAREGIEVEREPRPVTIHELELLEFAPSDYPELHFRVRCSTGTYVRTLVDDIARALGGRAHLTALRRLSIGSLVVADAGTPQWLAEEAARGRWQGAILSPGEGLGDLPEVPVPRDLVKAVSNGVVVPCRALSAGDLPAGPVRMLGPHGRLLAVYKVDENRAAPEVVVA